MIYLTGVSDWINDVAMVLVSLMKQGVGLGLIFTKMLFRYNVGISVDIPFSELNNAQMCISMSLQMGHQFGAIVPVLYVLSIMDIFILTRYIKIKFVHKYLCGLLRLFIQC